MGKSLALLILLVVGTVFAQESRLMPDYFDHPCVRTCEDGVQPMICQYRFVAESYETMSKACYGCAASNLTDCSRDHCVPANGFVRNIKTVNRGIPGPTIQVCEGDTIMVDLENYFAMSEGLAIHWHGILQRFSPHMDGVGMITQCPIQAFSTFEYRFVALDPGTHFWHAHTGLQRGEGMFGSFVVRQPPSREPHIDAYDFDLPEHVIVVNEWQNRPLVEVYTAFYHGNASQSADSIMINGYTQDTTGALELPRAEFQVEPGQRYRFRVINAGSLFCPIQISIDDHNMTLIASDGRPFEPFVVESFDTYSAERYDFILTADQPGGSYWLRALGLGTCQGNNLEEIGLIRYLPSPERDQEVLQDMPPVVARPELTSPVFNAIPQETSLPLGDPRDQIIGMDSVEPDDRSLTDEPDHQFLLEFADNIVTDLHYFDPDLYPAGSGPYPTRAIPQINRISNRLGPVSLLAQMDQVPRDLFCNVSSVGETCQNEWCECVHKLTVQQGQVIEVVLMSPMGGGFTHPFHMHGYSFRVVAMDRGPGGIMTSELFREMDARGEIARKLSRAPLKDTVAIPDGGYVILRVLAENPGVWFAHCHLAFHAEIGMSFSLEVLMPDGRLPPPPPNFPTCGPFAAPEPESSDSLSSPSSSNQQLSRSGLNSLPPSSPSSSTPAWVYPVIGILGGVIGILLFIVTTMFRQKKKAQIRERHLNFPSYHSDRDSTSVNQGADHFSYSKRDEKTVLTS